MLQTAGGEAERADRETEGEDEEVLGEIHGRLQESCKSLIYKFLHDSILYCPPKGVLPLVNI